MPASIRPREARRLFREDLPQDVRDLEIVRVTRAMGAGRYDDARIVDGIVADEGDWRWPPPEPGRPLLEIETADGRVFSSDEQAIYEALRDAAWALIETAPSNPPKRQLTRRQRQKQCRAAVRTHLRDGEIAAEAVRLAEREVPNAYDGARHSELTDISDRLYRWALKTRKAGDF